MGNAAIQNGDFFASPRLAPALLIGPHLFNYFYSPRPAFYAGFFVPFRMCGGVFPLA
jgi:hypothetical protein